MALDKDANTLVLKAQLNADGFIVSAGGALVIPYINGRYDLWLFPSDTAADNNDTSNAIRIADNIAADGSGSSDAPTFAEVQITLATAQTRVVFAGISAARASVFIGSATVDRGRLIKGVDYNLVAGSDDSIDLVNSFPAGSICVAVSDLINAAAPVDFIRKYLLLDEPVNDTGLLAGDVVNLKERTLGNGGGSMWDVVEASTVSPNTFNVVQCLGAPLLALVLRVVIPAKLSQYGAIDGQDSTVAIQTAIDNEGSIDVDGDYIFSSSLAVNLASITIVGSGSLAGANRSSAITYSDLVKTIILKDFTLKTCAGTQTINDLTSSIDFVRVTNVTFDDNEIGIHLLGTVKNAVFEKNTFNNLHRTLLDQSCQGIKIGNNQRATALLTKKISIVNNHFTDIVNDFNRETHAFIVYGREVVATGNVAEGVTHSFNTACETYYFKADIVTCTGNTVLNQGVSNDGCINFKGGPEGDVSQVTGQRITCTGNAITNEDLSLSIIGISCTDEHATITGNTLHNTWLRAFSGNDMLIAGNTIYMERSTGSITWIEVENCNRVTIKDNKIHVIANNFDVNTAQAARVRTSASAMDDIKIINNEMIVEYPDLTTGSNTVAALQLWAENFDITNVRVEGNNLTLVTPLIGAVADRQFIYFSGVNNISGKVVRNVTDVDLLYFDDNSYTGRTLEFIDNIVNDVLLVASDKGFEEKATDVRVRNEGATAIRTANLPLARAGITMDFLCTSPTYTMPVVRTGSDTFTDAATIKTLAVGASMKLRCFTTGIWHIENDAGVIT